MKIAKKCKYCGNQFTAQTLKNQYCSHQCNAKHYKIRQREIKKMDELKPPIQNAEITPYDSQLSYLKAKEILSIKDVMILLGISRSSVYRLIKNHYLKAAKFGSKVIIRKKDLKNLIKHQIDSNYSENIILNKGVENYLY